jgi:transposase
VHLFYLPQEVLFMALREYNPCQHELFWSPPQDVLPSDHLCFILDEIVELLDFSPLPDRTKTPGSPAYDARLLVKILFYGYATGTFSSRQLMRACREQLPYTYLTRQQYPDHRTISDFRKENWEFISEAFSQIVKIAAEMGMVRLGMVALDSTRIRANASREATIKTDKIDEEIAAALRQAIELDEEEDRQYGRERTGDEQGEGLRTSGERRKRLEKVTRRLKRLSGAKKAVEGGKRNCVNMTDTEATFEQKGRALLPVYSAHASSTEDGVVVDAFVHDNPADYEGLPKTVEQIKERFDNSPDCLLADSGYYSRKNLAYLKKECIEGYLPSSEQARDAKEMYEPRKYSKDKFTYDDERDVYICPMGKELTYIKTSTSQGNRLYRRKSCRDCSVLKECVRGTMPYRLISRSKDEQLMMEMKERMESAEGKAIYGKRKTMIEPPMGHIKKNLRFRQFYLRGRRGAEIEWLMLCIGINIRKIGKFIQKTLKPSGRGTIIRLIELHGA